MRFVGLTAGLVKPNTLTWNGSSRNAPDTPAGAVSADTKKATSRGISGLTSTPGPEKYIQGSRLYRNLPYSVSMHPIAERNCLINRSRSYFGVPRASIRGKQAPFCPLAPAVHHAREALQLFIRQFQKGDSRKPTYRILQPYALGPGRSHPQTRI